MEIRTDSKYAIKAVTQYFHHWRENADENGNWYNSKGEIETLPGLFSKVGASFRWLIGPIPACSSI